MSLAAKTGGEGHLTVTPREVAELLRFFGGFIREIVFFFVFVEGKKLRIPGGEGEKLRVFFVDQLDASMEGGTF